ncbi:MAG TPA: universal stress protein, partial [Halococcus sp.]|nr:universal stress protein [Halococcus sp.]
MSVAVETVLTPVDGSEQSLRAIEYAVAIAERYDARVHALYVL